MDYVFLGLIVKKNPNSMANLVVGSTSLLLELAKMSPFWIRMNMLLTKLMVTYGDFPAHDLQVLFARLYTFHFQTFAGHVTVPLNV